MLLTVTLNPSIDISYFVDNFQMDHVNRTDKVTKTPGGKGLNVSRVLHQLKIPVTATGFLGGHTGELLKDGLDQLEIKHSFSPCAEETRNCIAILSENKQTEILEPGPTIKQDEINQFLKNFTVLLKTGIEWVTLSGSLPQGCPDDFYQTLLALSEKEKCKVLLDSSGPYLQKALAGKNKPYLIKPNHQELADLLQKKPSRNTETLLDYLKDPLFDGVSYIVVTLGAEGALIKNGDNYYKASLPKIQAINPVGSGDASLAGIAAALYHKKSLSDVLKTGMTTGLLNTLEAQTGTIDIDHFNDYFDQIHVEKL
ncbi:1-phosphofructokinase family hexose kinase [Candidatus Enterococcus clewellii]|uniref:Tagatose-6-phosphate kinase n=1 Tax=Candidatus Enterococcus clewellii TaxID=1834193 RepID=A0A242K4C4_9ENTE|nr:hexose kinase [Enterococcus sp. 9E7_DIV0242]OTP13650.1 tagatose-6-phosphate kinase [Enterococcus sp. 9E7_DIV0242]